MGRWKDTQEAYHGQEDEGKSLMKIYDMCDDYRKLITSLLPFITDELALHELYVKVLMLSGKGSVDEEG